MSKIEWTEQTWNPTAGCTWASPGCDHCYAVTMTRRLEAMGQTDYAGLTTNKHFNGKLRTLADKLDKPLKRRKPTMYFVNSMSDLFHKDVPFEYVDRVFAIMALAPQHTFQVLTKRPERMAKYVNTQDRWKSLEIPTGIPLRGRQFDLMGVWPLPNAWLGVSIEDQERADQRREAFSEVIAAVRFVSYEPALSAVDWNGWEFLNWMIVGGESGSGARPFDVEWARSSVEWCNASAVAPFVKQLGAKPIEHGRSLRPGHQSLANRNASYVIHHPKGGDISEFPEDLRVRQFPRIEVPLA